MDSSNTNVYKIELLTPEGKYNYVAYLLADENGVSIKVAKYARTDKVDLIKNEEYGYCSLIKATYQVLDKLKVENATLAKITSSERLEKNLVEPIPMREAIINAIIHSDYSKEIPPVFEIFSDRLPFTSHGGLLPGQSEEDFFSCSSMPRNRELMRAFKDLGLVERLGSGMSKILRVYERNIFKISVHFIKVEFSFSVPLILSVINDGTKVGIEDNDKNRVILLLKNHPPITIRQLATELQISPRQINRIIKDLKEQEVIIRIGSKRNGYRETKN